MAQQTGEFHPCCSFGDSSSINGIACGFNAKAESNKIVPLISCCKSIESHCKRFHINVKDIDNEADLLKHRGGLFDIPKEQCTICPNHRYRLGLGWRSSQQCMLNYCSKEKETRKRKKPLIKGTISLHQSIFLWKQKQQLVQIGSGVCSSCRKDLVKEIKDKGTETDVDSECLNTDTCMRDSKSMKLDYVLCDQHFETKPEQESERTEHTECSQTDFTDEESQGSEWCPGSQDLGSQESEYDCITKRKALDNFLSVCGLDPVRQLQCNWIEASERTKRDYTNKATSVFQEILHVFAPGQEDFLADAVLQNMSSTKPADHKMLEILSAAYNQASDWGTQRQILSLFASNHSLKEIQKFIPDLSKYKYTAARKHSSVIGSGQPVHEKLYSREGLTDEQIEHFMDFVMSPCIMTDAPYGETHLKLSSGEVFHVPKIILNSVRSRVIEQYESFCQDTDFVNVASSRSYLRILEAVEPSIRKCMRGLDNYAADGAKGFDDLKKVTELLGKQGKGAVWQESVEKSLTSGKQYLKLEYKLHVSKESEIADHCCQFALSDCSSQYTATCQHEHKHACIQCDDLTDTLASIEKASKEVSYQSVDQEDDTLYVVAQSIQAIQEWKKHFLRSCNQDRARSDILHNLSDEEVLIERDWAMKFLPMLYRESQTKWFGKRGLNWHVSVATYLSSNFSDLTMHTIIHVFDNASQDGRTSNGILRNTLQRLHELNPSLKKAYIRSDNAGCFHGFVAVAEVALINETEHIKVVQIDFADPQGGKSICDRKAAHIKSSVRKYVNEGHDVRTASEFKEALVKCSLKNVAVVVALPPESSNKKEIKSQIGNITTLNNFAYHETGIQVFRQYGIGEGKFLSMSSLKLQLLSGSDIEILEVFDGHLCSVPPKMAGQGTLVPSSRNVASFNTEQDKSTSSEDDEIISNDVGSNLFTCPEPNCLSSFSKYGNLVRHLDVGNHRTQQIIPSLLDKSKTQYAEKIERKLVGVPNCSLESNEPENLCRLSAGWALKQRKPVKRFTDTQNTFLKEKFAKGERTGHKCDPEEVSSEMRVAKNSMGKRIFGSDEFLSANQIASYFSRLVLEKKKSASNAYENEDIEAARNAETFEELQVLAKK